MNRIPTLSHTSAIEFGESNRPVESGESASGEVCHHSVFTPLHYESNYAYPLLVWLHSNGDDEGQLHHIMPELSLRNYVALGPRASVPLPGRVSSYAWSDDQLSAAERVVFDCIDVALSRFNIARHRIFLGGFEAGGTMAMRIGLSNPRSFAGVASIGGPFPLGYSPLTKLNDARDLPFLISQGRDSRQYPIQRSCAELRVFHAAGMCVNLRQYPCGDELDTLMLRDMDAWMMELVTGVPSSKNEMVESPFSTDFDLLN